MRLSGVHMAVRSGTAPLEQPYSGRKLCCELGPAHLRQLCHSVHGILHAVRSPERVYHLRRSMHAIASSPFYRSHELPGRRHAVTVAPQACRRRWNPHPLMIGVRTLTKSTPSIVRVTLSCRTVPAVLRVCRSVHVNAGQRGVQNLRPGRGTSFCRPHAFQTLLSTCSKTSNAA